MSNSTPTPAAWRLGLVGRKVGMTRIFTEEGESIPVTVLDVSNNRVAQVKTPEIDGYAAVQLAYGERRASRVTKAEAGHYAKAGVEAGSILKEFRLDPARAAEFSAGAVVAVESLFEVGQQVDVTGTTIGKGFAGTIKRHHFGSQRASHGNSRSHRVPGSIGQAQDPGRIFPGKKMSGHLGDVTRTVQNLDVVRVDAERGLLLVKGAVPGHKNADIVVRPAVKATPKKGA
ncbi:Large ribosomal subunit protein uL3 OS=Castellaniella defragrans (strain DSM / CCUG 39792 /65Phen) OX=1437824 GN=rplC PE=3 SV=1 [Castellaniella denitrificans]|uniref:50S ribosomal protein L3 n=1 Tax=Castellaniella sp. TaxID=1955812 RepID=UPI002AFF0777|nr:50S ribosomal protein L3 [Castellaniella sp.]